MNSSAKVSVVTLLAAAALGAAVFTQGCTATSGTDNDTDGGTQSSSGTSGASSSGTSGRPATDAGGDAAPTNACAGNKQSADNGFAPATCQPCLEQKCCDKLKTCFDIPDTAEALDCNEYTECTDKCATDADPTTCQKDCDDLAVPGVVDAYDAIVTCGGSSCKTECE